MSFLFSGIETGVFSLNRLRVRQQMREGGKRAKILFNFYREPEKFYWTILLGNTFSNATFITLLVLILKEFIDNNLLYITLFLLGVFVLFAFCDLLPKTLFRTFPNRLCILFAKPFRIIQIILSPLISLIHKIFGNAFEGSVGQPLASRLFENREELKKFMEESDESLSEEERFMISQVLRLNERTLGQLAIPLNMSITASVDRPISHIIKLCKTNRIPRIPIWKFTGGQRKVTGIATLKTSLYREDYDANKPASYYIQPPLFLPSDLKVEAALKRMQRSGHWLAIVTSKSQREVGIVALKDILKVIFNEDSK
jgi:CBS domain containing-hemolysin-like protein